MAESILGSLNPLGDLSGYSKDGFSIPPVYAADGNGLPFLKVKDNKDATFKRNNVVWFVPNFGTVRMYINPNSISYSFKKIIGKDKTKGGYVLQYWGEDLTTLNITGTTGSSGVEGINALYEVYRAEQYAFDGAALIIAAGNSAQNSAANAVAGAIGGLVGNDTLGSSIFSSLTGGQLGVPSSITNLAELAFTVEMYYDGWVFRGFFESMTITEKTDLLFDYTISFAVTQRRGYRDNYLPWQRSPKQGPSDWGTPHSLLRGPGEVVSNSKNEKAKK